MDKKGKN